MSEEFAGDVVVINNVVTYPKQEGRYRLVNKNGEQVGELNVYDLPEELQTLTEKQRVIVEYWAEIAVPIGFGHNGPRPMEVVGDD